MKKIFYYLMSAVVAFGAMACQNDIDENITPDEGGNGEKVSFVAEIGDVTRVSIGDKVDGKGYPITLDADDVLIARAYDQGEWGDPYTFTTTDGDNFSCDTAGVSELIGKEVIIYNGNDNSYCSLCGINGISLNAAVNPFEANSTIKFTIGNAVLMFESEYDVTFNTTTDGFFSIATDCPNKQPDDNQNSITIPASEGVHYIAVNGGKEADLSYSIDGVECKKIENYTFVAGKLYNLGTLEKIDRVYLAPGEWEQENAWFAAYFYKNAVESVASASATRAAADANEVWVKMTDNDGDGTYECIVPEGFPNVVFCRMKSDDTETMSFDNAWNQTVDIAIDTTAEDFHENNSYYITSWGNDEDGENKKSEGAWGLAPDAVVTPNETSTWSLASDWDGTEVWSDKDMVTTSTANLYVLKNVALEAYSEFKVRKDHLWDESYGGGYSYINANHYVQLYNNGQINVSVTETGNYDIYFHSVYKLLYVVTTGTDYTTATWQEANGQGPAVEAPEFTDALVYLVPDMWAADGAWFSAHFFNAEDGAVDVKMTDEDADGIYECNVPVGMESVIFCRMNPAYDEFSWDDGHVWTQGANLTIGVAPNNYYYITDWETGEWNVEGYDPNATVPSTPGEASPWSLSGTFNEWGDAAMVTTSIANVFVVEDVTLDAYASFKVRKDKLWDENYGGGIVYMNPNGYIQVFNNGSNISITAAGTYDVYFDYANKLLYLVEAGTDYTTVAEQTVEGEEPEVEEPEVTANVLYLVPNANWKVDNARFAAYFFNNSGNAWVSMVDSDSDGIYEVNIPTGYTFGDNVIFCRMNPGTTANNWNNKWNQTADLTIPTDGKNLYTVADGTWDKGGGTWSTK